MSAEVMGEVQEIRALARQFAAERVRPHVERWDRDAAFDDDVIAQLAELGFLGLVVPEAAGGIGLGRSAFVAAVEELAAGNAAVALTVVLHSVVAVALAERDAEAAGALAAGELLGTMPIASSGKDGVIRWVANAGRAHRLLVPTDEGAQLFDIDGASAEAEDLLGLRPLRVGQIDVTGRKHEMLAYDPRSEDGAAALARLGVAATAVGIARMALEHARDYAAQREQFGRPLRAFEGMQNKLADMTVLVRAAESLVERAAAAGDASLSSAAKVFASEAAIEVTTQAVQVFGGYGYMRDYPVERLMRDAKATELMAEPNDRHRARIAAGLYGG